MSISWLVTSSVLTILKVHGKLRIHPLPPPPHKRISSCSVSCPSIHLAETPIMSCCCPIYTVKEYPLHTPTPTHSDRPPPWKNTLLPFELVPLSAMKAYPLAVCLSPSPQWRHTLLQCACPVIRKGIPSCSVLLSPYPQWRNTSCTH